MIRVRFGGFSLLKITKGLKANWVDKLSHFGGTAGLFSGVSYITFFEILEFIVISFFVLCKYKKNKVKITKDLEAKKTQSKEYENTIEDLKKKVDANSQKFDAMDNKMDLIDYKMDAMEEKLNLVMEKIMVNK